MNEAKLTQTQKSLLKRFTEIGGCVNYVVLDFEPRQDASAHDLHRQAAIAGLEIIAKRFSAYASKTSADQNIPIGRFFSVKIDFGNARSLTGQRISDRDFLGPGFDYDRKELAKRQSYSEPGGYAYAFSDPPYSLYAYAEKKRVSLPLGISNASPSLCHPLAFKAAIVASRSATARTGRQLGAGR